MPIAPPVITATLSFKRIFEIPDFSFRDIYLASKNSSNVISIELYPSFLKLYLNGTMKNKLAETLKRPKLLTTLVTLGGSLPQH
jgi:predicted transport protein